MWEQTRERIRPFLPGLIVVGITALAGVGVMAEAGAVITINNRLDKMISE